LPASLRADYDVDRLYALKGEVVSRGVEAVTGLRMPVFTKRRFQHGALSEDSLRRRLPFHETEYRKQFLSFYQ
jgi:asparagine synthase (glutamine-hydrolysing)